MSEINQQQNEQIIDIDISKQELTLLDGDTVIFCYKISTAKNGVGQQMVVNARH